ncbi:Sedlin [Delitschia confertaspora ATCC 74209]|uniref:Trafficking protein particle complex subunit 2-like protein n=1 Tax=Delitschia confertaspora ATCC 74209 TaxID=1513339 RepID=A0A9P4MP85_9PLEO|nr:Sedlin [Delitschia confertaspora ATCC 74209]
MTGRVPSIACIGVIGKQNNPLHISIFSSPNNSSNTTTALEYEFLLSSCLDIFEARLPYKPADQDFGLLQAVDERLAMYGWLTNTGVKFVVVVDMEGREAPVNSKWTVGVGLRAADLKGVFKSIQTAYIALLRNPFYNPDEHTPAAATAEHRVGSTQITSRRFIQEVQRIGESWGVGVGSV